MSVGALLWSFQGRINRKPYWLAGLAIVVAMIVLLSLAAGAGDFSGGSGTVLVLLILSIPFIWIALALGAKRLHDRDKSAWWLLVFYLLPSILQGAGEHAGGQGVVLALVGLAISIWALIELGFLRGTAGPNRYGPDPLAAAAPATA